MRQLHRKASARAIKAIGASGLVMVLLGVGLPVQPAHADGLYAWGSNFDGQLGDGTLIAHYTPVPVLGMSSGVTAIAAGATHSLALKNGVLYAWGDNSDGQFGDGGAEDYSATPVAVSGFGSGITAIAGGASYTLAVRSGALYGTGYNGSGQLGDGTTTEYFSPVPASGMGSGVTIIRAGKYFSSLAVKDGGLYAWGANSDGLLGDGTTTERHTRVAVSGMGSGVTAIAIGNYHTMAIQNGALFAWGRNDEGQLGDGTTTDRHTPVAVSSMNSGVTSVAAGVLNSLAVRNGQVYAWGINFNGELGHGTTDLAPHSTPELVSGLSGITEVAADGTSFYALDLSGNLWTWGENFRGQLGLGDTNDRLLPTEVFAPAGYKFTSIDAGGSGFALATVVVVPEPESFVLSALGVVGLAVWFGCRRGRSVIRFHKPSCSTAGRNSARTKAIHEGVAALTSQKKINVPKMKNTSTWLTTHCLRRLNIRHRVCCVLVLELIGWTARPARAIEVTWTGGINSNWSNNGNWDVHVPLSGDSVFFPNTGQTNVRADFSSYPDTDPLAFDQPALHLQSLKFDAAAPVYSIELYTSGASSPMYQARLDLDGAGVVNQSSVAQNFIVDRGGGHGVAGGDDVGVDGSRLSLNNSASAGNNVSYHVLGGFTTFQTTPAGLYIFLRASGGSVVFHNSASAGGATFVIDGGAGNGGIPAFVEFHNNSTAADGMFTNNDGAAGPNPPGEPSPVFGFGGQTNFYDTASADTATLSNIGWSLPYPGGYAGITNFRDYSKAGNASILSSDGSASIHNRGSTADLTIAGGGGTQFFGHSSAVWANIINEASTISYNHGGGYTYFGDDSTAANAHIDNLGGNSTYGPGTTSFTDRSTAANADISNRGLFGGLGGVPASTTFAVASSAGSATIHNFPDADIGGLTQFYGLATAANAHIILEPGYNGGSIVFNDDSTAGSAFLDASANGTTGLIKFKGHATAADSTITLGLNSGVSLQFSDFASAGTATIDAGELSVVQFSNTSTAANANIAVRVGSSLSFSGSFDPGPTTSAGNATIHLDGATSVLNSGARATFVNHSTAADSSITVDGAAVADSSAARLAFITEADAGNATILLKSSPISGNPGGTLVFASGGSGPTAHVTMEAGSVVYVAGNAGIIDTSIGYITGAGNINLGASTLIVGALGQNATLSGQISGNGGSFVKTGPDALTLTGTNTYTGLTTVDHGTLILNGSIPGNAEVNQGATFKGTANVGGTLICNGICSPGTSPGTFTLGGLNLMSGSTLQFELGATRDHIVVTNNGNITLGGLLDLSILSGFNPALGQTFSLFEGSIGSITGAFSAVNAPIINGHALSLVYGTNSVMLELGNAGDFNGDGTVDSTDYVVWRKGLGTTYTQSDYNAWRAHFGQSTGAGGAGAPGFASAAVPEPATVTLFLMGFVIAGAITRRITLLRKL